MDMEAAAEWRQQEEPQAPARAASSYQVRKLLFRMKSLGFTTLLGSGHNRRTAVLACVYAVVVAASYFIAYEVRFDFLVPEAHQLERARFLALVVGIKLIALVASRQLGTLLTYFSIPDLF